MADSAVVLGAGPIGLATAMLLARDGHEVLVVEKDRQASPATAAAAWEGWTRPGVAQFRQAHFMQPRFRRLLDLEFPDLRDDIVASGGARFNLIQAFAPSVADRSPRDDDHRFETLTGRRPVLESAFARVAENTPGVKILRGVSVEGPIEGRPVRAGVPHVTGVRTTDGEAIPADLVVDAMGRRSKLPEWIVALGGRPPHEEAVDAGFAYYTRHYQSGRGRPEVLGPIATALPTLRVLTVPADNDAWTIAVVAMAGDRPMKALRRNEVWERVVASIPHTAHWLEGEPLGDVAAMAGVMDRYRRFVVDDQPVVTGVVAVGDAWACTNPSAGRGMSLGLAHAIALRDVIRNTAGHPAELAEAFDRVTEATLTPWYRQQVDADRRRAAETQATIEGRVPEPPADPMAHHMQAAFFAAAAVDADVARAALEVLACLSLPADVMARPGMVDKVAPFIGADAAPPSGPTRTELLALTD